MEVVAYIIIAMIVGIALSTGINAVLKNKQNGKAKFPWEDVRLIVVQTLIDIKEVQDTKALGYQALEDHAVELIMEQIEKAEFFTPAERALISEDFVRSAVAPRLKQIKAKYPENG